MNNHYDVIIIGAGSFGMATGYFVARQGIRTLLIDSYNPPHGYGSHHGETRLFRQAYTIDEPYTPLAIRAGVLWDELMQETLVPFFHRIGVVNVSISPSGLDAKINTASRFHVPVELLDAVQLQTRWSGISVPEGAVALFEPIAGILYCEQAISAYRDLLLQHGATLKTQTPVERLEPHTDGVSVYTKDACYTGERLLISAGAWTGNLLHSLSLPVSPIRKTVAWFKPNSNVYRAPDFPGFTFTVGESDYYGFPDFDGKGLKIGRHDTGHPINPQEPLLPFGRYSEDEADVRDFLETFMPQAAGQLNEGKTCIYTMTPDEDFIIDTHPEHPHIVIAAGFSGHGFKFASALGEELSNILVQGKSNLDLSRFSLGRFE
ncbi:N-methyl-L-tryptophan oxidase [Aneurinibacillus migulanus]|uniref:N-methyl-L-tryptophan oxidase n=1 Tax=Aneurinibacillus migulanus TaxID=47500 RepID=UPI002E1DC400|nr:N-methyl-L-tryptophan oxidase [Aneurinibacillus migulanus]MED4729998.1 N-methyl-L-tryptophan oxidase [Aneurinibacillus migulanus]